jgi:dUTP pyrophosphatase
MPVDTKPVLRFAKLTEHAFEPVKGSEKAAGFDLKRFAFEKRF